MLCGLLGSRCVCSRHAFVAAALRDMAGSWQEYIATDLGVEDDLGDEETSGLAPMIGLFPGSTFEAKTRITRRCGCGCGLIDIAHTSLFCFFRDAVCCRTGTACVVEHVTLLSCCF